MTERRVAIYRNLLFVPNEAFIVRQAMHLRRYRPLFTGLDVAAGVVPWGHIDHVALTELCGRRRAALSTLAFKAFRVSPQPLLGRIASFAPDVMHAHFGPDAFWALPLVRDLRVPLVVTFHGYDVNRRATSSPATAAYTILRRSVFRRAARIIAVSDFLHGRLLDAGCPNSKIVRHYMGVDTAFFRRSAPSDTRPTIAFVGRLVEFKGCALLLEAVARLPFASDLKVLIVGSGPGEARLREIAGSARADVEFLGTGTPELVRSVLERASVFCLPSFVSGKGDEEALPMVVLEAQAMGVPVVSTRIGGIPEAVADGASGILVPQRDVGAMADAFETLLTNDALHSRMSTAARAHVESKFDIVAQTAALEGIYDDARSA